jgi:predicted PurR-regulated permease PerM
MAVELNRRQQRWLDALLVLSTIAVFFVVLGFLGSIFAAFGDIILVFFLAWLVSFIVTPVAAALERAIPRLPRVVAVVAVYAVVLGLFVVAVLLMANALVGSMTDFVRSAPEIRDNLPAILAPWQQRIDSLGFAVDLVALGQSFLDNVSSYAAELAGPLQQVAVASLGVLGNLLFVVILSIYGTVDRERTMSFLYRLVPPGWEQEARLFQVSLNRSFAGFLRGQAAMGLTYATVAAITSLLLNLPFLPVTTATSGILMAIPFFGPFVSWAPPVLVAILLQPDATLPALALMGLGWFVVMNVVQPRLMGEAVGIHPIVVLASVIIGSRVAGVAGAIFGIPIAAVLSAFFFHFFTRARERGSVAVRAARRLEEREGRPVRRPVEPEGGVDADVVDETTEGRPTQAAGEAPSRRGSRLPGRRGPHLPGRGRPADAADS